MAASMWPGSRGVTPVRRRPGMRAARPEPNPITRGPSCHTIRGSERSRGDRGGHRRSLRDWPGPRRDLGPQRLRGAGGRPASRARRHTPGEGPRVAETLEADAARGVCVQSAPPRRQEPGGHRRPVLVEAAPVGQPALPLCWNRPGSTQPSEVPGGARDLLILGHRLGRLRGKPSRWQPHPPLVARAPSPKAEEIS